jgi:hypothetical protein
LKNTTAHRRERALFGVPEIQHFRHERRILIGVRDIQSCQQILDYIRLAYFQALARPYEPPHHPRTAAEQLLEGGLQAGQARERLALVLRVLEELLDGEVGHRVKRQCTEAGDDVCAGEAVASVVRRVHNQVLHSMAAYSGPEQGVDVHFAGFIRRPHPFLTLLP